MVEADYHKKYYQENKNKINKQRADAFVLKEYKFLDKEDLDLWRNNRPLLKSIFRNKDKIKKEELIYFIEKLYNFKE